MLVNPAVHRRRGVPCFYGNGTLIAIFTTPSHLSLSWALWIYSTNTSSPPTFLEGPLEYYIYFFCICLFQTFFLFQIFHSKCLLFTLVHAMYLAHLIFLCWIIIIIGTSDRSHNSASVNVHSSHYFMATNCDHITTILRSSVSTDMCTYWNVNWIEISSLEILVLHIALMLVVT